MDISKLMQIVQSTKAHWYMTLQEQMEIAIYIGLKLKGKKPLK